MKLNIKFRVKESVPFSIETLSGRQFRCGVCGKLFFDRDELDIHLKNETYDEGENLAFPELDRNISVMVLYTQDIRDRTNTKYPRLHKGDKLLNVEKSDETFMTCLRHTRE